MTIMMIISLAACKKKSPDINDTPDDITNIPSNQPIFLEGNSEDSTEDKTKYTEELEKTPENKNYVEETFEPDYTETVNQGGATVEYKVNEDGLIVQDGIYYEDENGNKVKVDIDTPTSGFKGHQIIVGTKDNT